MSNGLKVWLWIILVLNAISLVSAVFAALIAPLAWISVLLGVGVVAGICILLFSQQKMGFFILCGCAIAVLVINILLGSNLFTSLLSAVFVPGITYLLMRPNWDSFN